MQKLADFLDPIQLIRDIVLGIALLKKGGIRAWLWYSTSVVIAFAMFSIIAGLLYGKYYGGFLAAANDPKVLAVTFALGLVVSLGAYPKAMLDHEKMLEKERSS